MAIQIHYWSKKIEKIMKYYTEILAFKLVFRQPAEGSVNFCILKIEDSQLMIAEPPKLDNVSREDHLLLEKISKRLNQPGPISVYIGIKNIKAYFDLVQSNEASIIEPLWNTPWHVQQFSVLDPDNNITTFYSS
jgi:uncharacterized glyoxalase superfamily protein PhnB